MTQPASTPPSNEPQTELPDPRPQGLVLGEENAERVTRYVVVEVNGNQYGMPTDSTVELMSSSMTQITRVPHSPEFITGVINHRGTIIPVIDARSLLGFANRRREAQELGVLLGQFRDNHIAWLDSLGEALRDNTTFDSPSDPDRCAFARWYASVMDGSVELCRVPLTDPVIHSIVERFDTPHRKFHALAKEVHELKNADENEKASAMVESVRSHELAVMVGLFDQVFKAVNSHYESMLVITECGTQKAAIAVDGVSFVLDCKDDDVEPLPDTADNTEFLSGLVHQPGGSYILIADLGNIYATACVAG